MSSTHIDDDVNHGHDDSFDSLPPGEKYHSPPFEEDPFDTSAIVIPETTVSRPQPQRSTDERLTHQNGDAKSSLAFQDDLFAKIKHSEASHQPSMLAQLLSSKEGSIIAATTSATMTTLNTSDSSANRDVSRGDTSFDFGSLSHRRAFSSVSDAEAMLPQLTSPLSPPAFNPADIILGSNEAIAGLDSPALSMAIPKTSLARRNDDAFNWLENTMSNLKIGKKDSLATMTQQSVTRNANVFQFPPPQYSVTTIGSVSHSSSVTQTSSVTAGQPKLNPPMNRMTMNSNQTNGRVDRNSVAAMPTLTSTLSTMSMTSSKSTTFSRPPSYAPPPAITMSQIRPQNELPQNSLQQSNQSFLSWPVRHPTASPIYQPMANLTTIPSTSPRPPMLTPAPAAVSPNPSILTPMPGSSYSPRSQASAIVPSSMPFMTSAPQQIHQNVPMQNNLNALPPASSIFNSPTNYQLTRPQQIYPSPPSMILQPQKVSQSPSSQQQQDQVQILNIFS